MIEPSRNDTGIWVCTDPVSLKTYDQVCASIKFAQSYHNLYFGLFLFIRKWYPMQPSTGQNDLTIKRYSSCTLVMAYHKTLYTLIAKLIVIINHINVYHSRYCIIMSTKLPKAQRLPPTDHTTYGPPVILLYVCR